MGLFPQTYIVGNASQSKYVASFIHRTMCQICGKELQDIAAKIMKDPNNLILLSQVFVYLEDLSVLGSDNLGKFLVTK